MTQPRRIAQNEVTPGIAAFAKRMLHDHHGEPIGFEQAYEENGRTYLGRIEQHFHEPGGPLKPWGPHKGVSIFEGPAPKTFFVWEEDYHSDAEDVEASSAVDAVQRWALRMFDSSEVTQFIVRVSEAKDDNVGIRYRASIVVMPRCEVEAM